MVIDYPPEFLNAVKTVLDDEGGYVNNPNDPGGETKFGISKRDHPDVDIAALTVDGAIEIYYVEWWLRYQFDRLAGLGGKVFDIAVNIGACEAIRCLQQGFRAVGYIAAEDGQMGPMTTDVCGTLQMHGQTKELLAAYRSEVAGYYRLLAAKDGRNDRFLRGWLARAYR